VRLWTRFFFLSSFPGDWRASSMIYSLWLSYSLDSNFPLFIFSRIYPVGNRRAKEFLGGQGLSLLVEIFRVAGDYGPFSSPVLIS